MPLREAATSNTRANSKLESAGCNNDESQPALLQTVDLNANAVYIFAEHKTSCLKREDL
jgi:hypothetical protein